MFERVPDQFHQFTVSRTSLPFPLSLPSLHGSSSFDLCTSHHQQLPLQQPNFLHQSAPISTSKNEDKQESSIVGVNLETERERSMQGSIDPWSNDEVFALLRVRSSMENWFPEFTWEHVSRKLAELGFKRSAEKCKEKFEEESGYFNNHINYSRNYSRVFGELEDLYHDDNQKTDQEIAAGKNKNVDKATKEEDEIEHNVEGDSKIDQTVGNPAEDNGKGIERFKSKKRKRQEKFEIFMAFCEDIIGKIMAQQEEMHNKVLEDMVKRDEVKLAREEAWKKQEMDRINKELELRAQEQALKGDRQATIINFLKRFSSSTGSCIEILGETSVQDLLKGPNSSNPSTSSSMVLLQNPNNNQSKPEAPISLSHQNSRSSPAKNDPIIPTSMPENLASENPSSTPSSSEAPQSKPLQTETVQRKAASNDKEDLGKRWPKDEVLALINIRSRLYNSNEDKEATARAPLWDRISQGMLEMGYKRSAKRCKEKWENINKYFRKTKDINKKRSVDSRTCPYFNQLSTLYNQGTLISPHSQWPEKLPLAASSLENIHPTD